MIPSGKLIQFHLIFTDPVRRVGKRVGRGGRYKIENKEYSGLHE